MPEIEKRRIWRKRGFSCIYEYAAKIAGMSREKVDNSLRILKKLEGKPILRKVAEEKGLNVIRSVLTISNNGGEEFWARKASEMSRHTMETYVREYKKQYGQVQSDQNVLSGQVKDKQIQICNFRTGPGAISEKSTSDTGAAGLIDKQTPAKIKITIDLDPETAEKLAKLKGFGEWDALMKELIALKEEKLQKELEAEKPKKVETDSRHVPIKIQRYVMKKTNGLCAFPGCKRRAEILHHTQRFALEKVHDPDRVAALCGAHHAIAHQGLIENEESSVASWRIIEEASRNKMKYWVDKKVAEYSAAKISV